MDMVTSIASMATAMKQQELQTNMSFALMGKAMDVQETTMNGLIDMMGTQVTAPPVNGIGGLLNVTA